LNRGAVVPSDVSPTENVVVLRGGNSSDLLNLTDRDITSIKQLVGSLDDNNIKKLARIVDAKIIEKIDPPDIDVEPSPDIDNIPF
jgi:hypothetical protein